MRDFHSDRIERVLFSDTTRAFQNPAMTRHEVLNAVALFSRNQKLSISLLKQVYLLSFLLERFQGMP